MKHGINYLLMVAACVAAMFGYAEYGGDPHLNPPKPPAWTTWGAPQLTVYRPRFKETCAYWERSDATHKKCWRGNRRLQF